jgi:IS5 family transposase
VKVFFERPYDGHTLKAAITNSTRLSGIEPTEIHVDKGYRGNKYTGTGKVHISGCGRKKLPDSLKKRKNRRSAIEPIIGHIKSDHRMNRCWLKGTSGDEINALMAGVGFNMRKMLKLLREFLSFLIEFAFPYRQHQLFLQVA